MILLLHQFQQRAYVWAFARMLLLQFMNALDIDMRKIIISFKEGKNQQSEYEKRMLDIFSDLNVSEYVKMLKVKT